MAAGKSGKRIATGTGGLALVALLACALVAAPPSAGAARRRRRAPSPAALAQSDARSLLAARSSRARLAALEGIARHLRLGVYPGRGRALVRGSERRRLDVYLYKGELQIVAQRLRTERSSFGQLALGFQRAGLVFGGRSLDGAGLAALVRARVRAARAHPSIAGGYALLLLRELGLRRHLDLAGRVSPDRNVLDSAQEMLIDLAAYRPAIAALAKRARGRAATARSASVAGRGERRAGAADLCSGPDANETGGDISGAQALVGALGGVLAKTAGVATTVTDLLDYMHAGILGVGVDFRVVGSSSQNGSFGTSGYRSAADMTFKAQAFMEGYPSDTTIDCGAMLGYTIPPHGGVSGIKVSWTTNGSGGGDPISHFVNQGANLGELSTINCDRSACRTTAGQDGVATLTAKPDDEYLPGVGEEKTANGVVTATALLLGSTGSTLGKVSEALGATKIAKFAWTMRWHQPRGYQVTLPAFDEVGQEGPASVETNVRYTNLVQCLASADGGAGVPHPTTPRPELGDDPRYPGPRGKEATINTFDGHPMPEIDLTPDIYDVGALAGPAEKDLFSVPGATVQTASRWAFQGPQGAMRVDLTVPAGFSPGSRTIYGTLSDVPQCPEVPTPH